MIGVHYLTEDPTKKYVADLNRVTNLQELRKLLRDWKPFVGDDAIAVAKEMDEADFTDFRDGLDLERKKKYAGDEWATKFGGIIIPTPMLKAAIVAENFKVPWGTAFIRLRDTGKL